MAIFNSTLDMLEHIITVIIEVGTFSTPKGKLNWITRTYMVVLCWFVVPGIKHLGLVYIEFCLDVAVYPNITQLTDWPKFSSFQLVKYMVVFVGKIDELCSISCYG
jgi:hypothetical protein